MIYVVNGLRGLDVFTVIGGIVGDDFIGEKYFTHAISYGSSMPFHSARTFDGGIPAGDDFLNHMRSYHIIMRDPDTVIPFIDGSMYKGKTPKLNAIAIKPDVNYIIFSYISESEIRTLQSIVGTNNVRVFNIVENPKTSYLKFMRDEYLQDISISYKHETERYDNGNNLRFEITSFIQSLINAVKLKSKYPIIHLEDIKAKGINYFEKLIKIYPEWYDETVEKLDTHIKDPSVKKELDDLEYIINNLGFDLLKELGY